MRKTEINSLKIVFILDSISQPRCIKRIKSFISHGFDVDVYGINRNKYNINAEIKDVKINIIGNQHEGKHYFSKFFNNNKEIRCLLNKYKYKNVIFYCFGMPLTYSMYLNGSKNYIYEIADILYGYKKFDKLRWLIKKLDILLIRKSILTVLTSEGFAKYFFKKESPQNVIIQPNKLDPSFSDFKITQNTLRKNASSLVFSFIGGFRSPNTIFRFAKIIGDKYPEHQFHFYGGSSMTKDLIELSESFKNIKYFGAFKNPEDLYKIYSKIDIVLACYDTADFNERILEPNKLYESLYFKKPIIVSEDTFLAERVNTLGCGFVINATNDESIITFIDSLTIENLKSIYRNIEKIGLDEVIDDNSKNIVQFIESVI